MSKPIRKHVADHYRWIAANMANPALRLVVPPTYVHMMLRGQEIDEGLTPFEATVALCLAAAVIEAGDYSLKVRHGEVYP